MNKEILELSQWLHEKGFEPDMWTNEDIYADYKELDITCDLQSSECTKFLKLPYFTLNRALELLPSVIDIDDKGYHALMINKEEYFIGYVGDAGIDGCPIGYEQTTHYTTSYHLAALRLLKQVVEKECLASASAKGESDG